MWRGALVVEGEGGGVGGVGGDADFGEAAGEVDPVEGRGDGARSGGLVGGFEVGGVEGVGEEGVLDVGGDEFLVLLLVLEAEGDAAEGLVGDGVLSRSAAMAASTWAR